MDSIIRRALTGTAEHPTLTFERTYRATPEELRSACTSPERLSRWLGRVDGEPRTVGDTYTAHLSHDTNDFATGQVLSCEDDAFSVSWTWQGERESVISARFTAVDDDHTALTLQHALTEQTTATDYGGGWEYYLSCLEQRLSGAEPSDDTYKAAAQQWALMTRAPMRTERVLQAPIDAVWAGLASAEGMRTWWWSHWSDVVIDADVREGGHYQIEAPGVGITLSGTYLSVSEPTHLAYSWQWSDSDGTAPDEAADIRLEETSEGTRVIVQHTGPWHDDAPATNYLQGWEFTLDQLAAALSGR